MKYECCPPDCNIQSQKCIYGAGIATVACSSCLYVEGHGLHWAWRFDEAAWWRCEANVCTTDCSGSWPWDGYMAVGHRADLQKWQICWCHHDYRLWFHIPETGTVMHRVLLSCIKSCKTCLVWMNAIIVLGMSLFYKHSVLEGGSISICRHEEGRIVLSPAPGWMGSWSSGKSR